MNDDFYLTNTITFWGDDDSLYKLTGKFTELEFVQSFQIMGDVLGFNSFISEKQNVINYGTCVDVEIFDCSITMRNDHIKIEHFRSYYYPPHRFLEQVCIKYNLNGKISANNMHTKHTVEFSSLGERRHDIISCTQEYYYNRDPEKFVNSLKGEFKHYTQDDWKNIMLGYHFVTKKDYDRIKKIFREEAWGGLFEPGVGQGKYLDLYENDPINLYMKFN